MRAGRQQGGRRRPSTAARVLERELRPAAGMGVARDRARLHLWRALAFLELDMPREALAQANVAAHLDRHQRRRALRVARACVERELGAGG